MQHYSSMSSSRSEIRSRYCLKLCIHLERIRQPKRIYRRGLKWWESYLSTNSMLWWPTNRLSCITYSTGLVIRTHAFSSSLSLIRWIYLNVCSLRSAPVSEIIASSMSHTRFTRSRRSLRSDWWISKISLIRKDSSSSLGKFQCTVVISDAVFRSLSAP